MLGDEHLAGDLTQEVFLRAWQRFDTVRAYDIPRRWLFKVATNLALSQLGRRSRHDVPLALLPEAHEPVTGDPATQVALSDLVHATLLRLSPKRRAALVLHEVYGFTTEEIGQMLGMAGTAVRMALSRGRDQFRAEYRREGGHEDGI